MSTACNLCGKPATQKCKSCQHVVYCCREHQKLDWKIHKLACQEIVAMKKQGQDWEADVQQGEYAGTFRWSQKKDFVQMPPYLEPSSIEGSWQDYFETRLSQTDLDDNSKIVLDVPMIDGLSFPMSFLVMVRLILDINPDIKDWLYQFPRRLNIIAIGCAERAEEHILRQTNYFQEIAYMMPSFKLNLWLVGPEISTASHTSPPNQQGPRMEARCYRGTLSDFCSEHNLLDSSSQDKTVVIGFNTGMASGDAALKKSWDKDISLLLEKKILALFTCANDHNDLKSENALMAELRAKYVLYPRKNPFQAVTVLHPPGQQLTGWYSANAFFYAVQGKFESRAAPRPGTIKESSCTKADEVMRCSDLGSNQGQASTTLTIEDGSITDTFEVSMSELYLPD